MSNVVEYFAKRCVLLTELTLAEIEAIIDRQVLVIDGQSTKEVDDQLKQTRDCYRQVSNLLIPKKVGEKQK